MMIEHEFGGEWTDRKLEKVRKYLPAYMKILSGKGFTTGYIDAFAGTGYRTLGKRCAEIPGLFDDLEMEDIEDYRNGSARIALRTEPPFDKYIFIEKDAQKCRELEAIKSESPELTDRIDIRNGDANKLIGDMCVPRVNWRKHRAVMFLDPFGMQVEWKTINLIAETKAIDLWYLFPIGAVNRLLEKKQGNHTAFAECLDRSFGTSDWKDEFYRSSKELSLFDNDVATVEKNASFDAIGNYIIKRLGMIFEGVVETPYILKNSKNSPLFMLCFAVGNPKGKGPALTIARDILMKD